MAWALDALEDVLATHALANTAAQKRALDKLPVLGSTLLYGFVNEAISVEAFSKTYRQRDVPFVVGAAAGFLDRVRTKIASKWSSAYFQNGDIKRAPISAGTLPYGDAVIRKYAEDHGATFVV